MDFLWFLYAFRLKCPNLFIETNSPDYGTTDRIDNFK